MVEYKQKKTHRASRLKKTTALQDKHSIYTPSSIKQFYSEVVAEFNKIVWPDRKVTVGLTGFVIVLTVILSIYLGSVDFFLGKLISMVLK